MGSIYGESGRRRRAGWRARRLSRRAFASQRRGGHALTRLALLGLALVMLAAGGGIAALYSFYATTAADVGSPGAVIAAVADYGGAQIFDRNGTLLYRFPDPQGGIQAPIPLGQISPAMINATVSTEDATFWSNYGFDVQGLGGAVLHNLSRNGDPFSGAGGSAITQQLVKNTLIPQDQRTAHSLTRKATELVYAVELTRDYPKPQILDWYLNTVNYGGVYDGIESASEGYFGVHAQDLDLAQAAMLAGIPQSPADYSPYANREGATQRQGDVLDLMVKHGYVTQQEADTAKQERLIFQPTTTSLPLRAPWFVEYVKQQLIARFGQHCFDTCGLVVQTTIDLNLQEKARGILDDNLTKYGDASGVHNGGILSIDARTGQILVMLGSRDYENDTLPIQGKNNFTTAILQPGSSFKPFVYLSLFIKRGYSPDSIIWDVPYTSREGYKCENPLPGNRTLGPIPVKLALGSSLNCAANRAADTAGVNNVIEIARKMGFTTLNDPSAYGASIATGGANVTMLDMVYAYSTMARNGNMIGDTTVEQRPEGSRTLDPVAITDVKDGRGALRYHYEPKTEQVVPPQYPYLVTSIISNCLNRRLIWSCSFPQFLLSDKRPVAIKTGTQQGEKTAQTLANWLFMYTPQLVTGGWVGNADRKTWTDVNGSSNAVGYAVQQVEDMIIKSYNIEPAEFEKPSGIASAPVHEPEGYVGCGPIVTGIFAEGTQPDVNNHVCKNGVLTVPAEQASTGGLEQTGRVCDLTTPTPDPRSGRSIQQPACVQISGPLGAGTATGTPSVNRDPSRSTPAEETPTTQPLPQQQPQQRPFQPPAPVFTPLPRLQPLAPPAVEPAPIQEPEPTAVAPPEPVAPVAPAAAPVQQPVQPIRPAVAPPAPVRVQPLPALTPAP